MSFGRITDSEGNEYGVHATFSSSTLVNRDGTVTHRHEDHVTGEHEESTEPLHTSPVRGVFAPWIWDLLDDALDPRNELSS